MVIFSRLLHFVAKFIDYILTKIYLNERRKVKIIRGSFQAKGHLIRKTSGGRLCVEVSIAVE